MVQLYQNAESFLVAEDSLAEPVIVVLIGVPSQHPKMRYSANAELRPSDRSGIMIQES